MRELRRSQLQPSALDVLHPGRVAVLFEGRDAAVEAQLGTARALVGGEVTDTAVWDEARRRQGRGARPAPIRPGRPPQRALDARRGRRPAVRRDRVRPGRGSAESRPPRRGASSGRSASASTRQGCSRDRGAREGVRPLRLLPADMPDVRPLERGDGLAARPDPADGEDRAGNAPAQPGSRRALRPLPRVHGLRHELPVGRPLRPPDRGDPGARRARAPAAARRAPPAPASLRDAAPPARGCAPRSASRRSDAGCPHPRWARPMLDLAPAWRSDARPPAVTPATGTTAGAVGLLTGCVQSVLFGDVNTATARVLAAAGYEVHAPAQGCCGALSQHAGSRARVGPLHRAPARPLRRRRVDRGERLRVRVAPEGARPAGPGRDGGARRAPSSPSSTRST